MGEAGTQLKAVGAANEELHETAKQALEWVRVSEERVAKAEARSEVLPAERKRRHGDLAQARRGRPGADQGRTRQAQGGRGASYPSGGRPGPSRAELRAGSGED